MRVSPAWFLCQQACSWIAAGTVLISRITRAQMRVSPTSSSLCTFKLVSESIVVKSLNRVQLFVTSWTAAHQAPHSSLSPRVDSNSCPMSWWYHPIILSLSPPSPPALNLSQHQGLFQWADSSHQVAKVLELQHQSFQWIFKTDFF